MEIREAIEELSLVALEGFKSKHDDFIDTISMLSSLTAWKPSEEIPMSHDAETDVWEIEHEEPHNNLFPIN